MKKNRPYVEPVDFFPRELREKYRLGEYAEEAETERAREQAEGREANDTSKDSGSGKQDEPS